MVTFRPPDRVDDAALETTLQVKHRILVRPTQTERIRVY